MDKKQWQFLVLNIYFRRTFTKYMRQAPLRPYCSSSFCATGTSSSCSSLVHSFTSLNTLAHRSFRSPSFRHSQKHSDIPRRHLDALRHLVAPRTFAPTDGVAPRRFLQSRPSPYTVSRGKNYGVWRRATRLCKNSRTIQFGRRLSGQHRADVGSFPTIDDQGLFVVKNTPDGTGVLLDELPSDLSPSVCRSAALVVLPGQFCLLHLTHAVSRTALFAPAATTVHRAVRERNGRADGLALLRSSSCWDLVFALSFSLACAGWSEDERELSNGAR